MDFGKSILPENGSYYKLNNASIDNGILTIQAGGSLIYHFTESDITKLTEYFRLSLMPYPYTDRYNPRTSVFIYVKMSDGTCYNNTYFPTQFPNNLFMQEMKFQTGEYEDFYIEIHSMEKIAFHLWELCPEALEEEMQTIINGVSQSLPKLLFDYNTWPLIIDNVEKTISVITFRLLDHTDLQGHFQMTYVASEACTLVLRFKDNEATELFSPLLYDLHAGRGSLGIPHAYLDRLAGTHSLIVTAQVTSGNLVVDTRGILFTIDGGYLAERMIDIGADMRDISIRQLSQDQGPDEIWIIGIEAGEAIVRKRKYNPKTAVQFEPIYSLGRAKDAAIEFDGEWVLRATDNNYTIETSLNPWIFWIDIEDNLIAQIGDDINTRKILDTGVSCVHACRGYKSQIYLEQDQGIICAYIKNKQAYYIQYQYNITTKNYRWGKPTEVDATLYDVTHISVNRLNDYRVQITVKIPTGIKTYISDRTYVNQAIPSEIINAPNAPRKYLAYLPANYDTSITVIKKGNSEDLLTLNFTVNRILQIDTYNINTLFSFNSSIPDFDETTGTPYVKQIKVSVDELNKETTFIISLNFIPKYTDVVIYFNHTNPFDCMIKLDDYGYITCPALTIDIDIAHLIQTTQIESVPNITGAIGDVQYRSINILDMTTTENVDLSEGSQSALIEYNEVQYKNLIYTEQIENLQIISTTVDYKKINDQPI